MSVETAEQQDESEVTETTERDVAERVMDLLRSRPDFCATGSVNGWRWVRFYDGEWHSARYKTKKRGNYVRGEILDEEAALNWFISNPAEPIPASNTTPGLGDDGKSVWKIADEQDVYRDVDRCEYCGVSNRDEALDKVKTTEDGSVLLCMSCLPSWEKCDQVVEVVETFPITTTTSTD